MRQNFRKVTQDLCDTGFQVIIYGEVSAPDVKNVLEWTYGNGIAILNPEEEVTIQRRKIALLAQADKGHDQFADFASRFLARNIGHIYELRVINTSQTGGING